MPPTLSTITRSIAGKLLGPGASTVPARAPVARTLTEPTLVLFLLNLLLFLLLVLLLLLLLMFLVLLMVGSMDVDEVMACVGLAMLCVVSFL